MSSTIQAAQRQRYGSRHSRRGDMIGAAAKSCPRDDGQPRWPTHQLGFHKLIAQGKKIANIPNDSP
jgi:hypothetical protein